MSISTNFGLDLDVFADLTDDPALLESTSTTTTLRQGVRTPYSASINGVPVNAYVTLESARLTRLSILEQQSVSNNNSAYWLVTGIFKPVKMNVEVIVDGEVMSLPNLMRHLANSNSGKNISEEEFLHAARRIGLNFTDGMPLFFQQFGANLDNFGQAVEAFKAAGAEDVLKNIKNQGRIRGAYQHNEGVEVTSLELGSVDRSKSMRKQGFLNLVDAQIEQFSRIVGLRKQAATLNAQIENNTSTLSQEETKALGEQVRKCRDLAGQWTTNWAGAQKRLIGNGSGAFTDAGMYDPVNAPCGRFTMVVNGRPVEVDLWTNSRRDATDGVSPAVTDAEIDESF